MSLPVKSAPYPFADSVGLRIREAKEQQRLSSRRLAEMADVSRRHLAELEKGSNVTLMVLKKTMKALGLTKVSLGSGEAVDLQSDTSAGASDALRIAIDQLDLGAALVLRAVDTLKAETPEATPTHAAPSTANDRELARRATSLIHEFSRIVRQSDTEEALDTIERLLEISARVTTPRLARRSVPRKAGASRRAGSR